MGSSAAPRRWSLPVHTVIVAKPIRRRKRLSDRMCGQDPHPYPFLEGERERLDAIKEDTTFMLKAAIVGATGIVGQQFVLALQQHPWFHIEALAASRRSAGQKYGEALRDPATGSSRWYAGPLPDKTIFDLPVEDAETLAASRFDVIFTGIESDAAKVLEPQYAKSCPVMSTASAFRYEDDVPVVIPGVNDDHAQLIERQCQQRGWQGFIAPNPNCTTVGLVISLAPL